MGVRHLLWWLGAVIAALSFVGTPASAVAAGPGMAGQGALRTCVLPARPGLTPAQLFTHPAAFDCSTSQADFAQGDYWVLAAALPADAAAAAVAVRSASVWQRQVTLFVRYADGAVGRADGFTSADAGTHLALGARFDLALPHRDARPTALLWHVEGSGAVAGIVVDARLVSEGVRHHQDLVMTTLYAALGGMVAALFVYNLALWGALRQPFQPVYCSMLLCVFLYGLSSSGWLGQLTGIDNNVRLRLNTLLIAATGANAIVFARLFFGPSVFSGWLRRAGDAIAATLVGTAVIYAALAPWLLGPLGEVVAASFVALMALVPAVLWRAWRTGSPYRWLFAVAWGAPIAVASLRIAVAIHLLGWRFWFDHSTIPALALEACLSALMIAARIRSISRERDEAREKEIAARLLADTDPLTGLLNRRSFLAQAIGRIDDQALVLIDIDHFKQINETIGHDGGDEVLRIVARMLCVDLPPDSLVARIGGEEFAILSPAADPPYPADILCRVRAAAMPYDLTVTVSTGACAGPLVTESDWIGLYRHADRALFEAKAAGRDRSRAAQPLARAA